MIKLILLAVVPFVTQHRNVVPKTEVTTNFYGSVTGVVDKAYIQSRIGTGIITDVRTNGVSVVSNNIANIIEVDPTVPEWAKSDLADPSTVTTAGKAADALKTKEALDGKLSNQGNDVSFNWTYDTAAYISLLSGYYGTGIGLDLYSGGGSIVNFTGHGIEPHIIDLPDKGGTFALTSDISETNPDFSNAVLAVGLNIDTNSVAVLNEIASTFGGFPIEGTATTVGGLLAALAAAIAWMKKNKVQTLKLNDNSVETSAESGVAKLDGFFKESNGLLNGRLVYERNATGLKDRAFNTLSFDGTEYNLSTALAAVTPTASGQPRDLLIVATATAATTISFTAGTIKGDKPTIDGSGTWLITLTEYASGVWYCRQIKMEDAA